MQNRIAAAWLALALLPAVGAAADILSTRDGSLGEKLKAVQADAVCRPGDTALVAEQGGAAAGVTADLSCTATLAQVSAPLAAGQLHVVDLRAPELFNNFHINGALNMSTSDLLAKTYLRQSRVLLVGSGKAEKRLYEACRRLRDNGFGSVRLLQGGMLSWLTQGQSVLGQTPALPPTRQLSAPELLEESYFDSNLFVFLPETVRLKTFFPPHASLIQLKGAGLSTAVARALKTRKDVVSAIILVGKDMNDAHRQAEALQKSVSVPVLVYADGLATYEDARRRQRAIIASHERPPRPAKCAL